MTRSRIALRALALLVACVSAPAVSAEEPVEAKVPLRLAPSPGVPVLFVLKSERIRAMEIQDRMREALHEPADKYAQKTTTEFSLEVQERRPDGTWAAFLRFGRIEAVLPDPLGAPKKWTSDGPLPTSVLDRSRVFEAVALGGAALRLVLDPGGAVASVEGLDAALKESRRTLNVPEGEAVLMTLRMRPEVVTSFVDAALGATPLPEGPVAKGDWWVDNGPAPFSGSVGSGRWLLRQNFTVEGAGPKEVSLRGTGRVEWTPPALPAGVGKDLEKRFADLLPKYRVEKSGVASVLRISPADGLPLSGSLETSVSYVDERRKTDLGAERIAETSTLARVASWPSGKKALPAPAAAPAGK